MVTIAYLNIFKGFMGLFPWRISKWRWGPVVLPDVPTDAMVCPWDTDWPFRTDRELQWA